MKPKQLPEALQDWVNARKKFHLSHAQIQMARELGLNPKKFDKLANHHQEPWKEPLPQFIETLYQKRFSSAQPEDIKSVEQGFRLQQQKRALKKAMKAEKKQAKGLLNST